MMKRPEVAHINGINDVQATANLLNAIMGRY